MKPRSVSIIVPTFNGASRIGNCLQSLLTQSASEDGEHRNVEILVVSDGSTDNTIAVVGAYPGVRVIEQANAGPAAARNRGALEAKGEIILFTDDDCVPMPDWLNTMLKPFNDPEVVGAKGIYRTRQKAVVARFVQIEYEDKYRLMAGRQTIDFIDTYSAAFLRHRFMEITGYDTSFPVACAEDIELSYRMSAKGWKMVFVPEAIVYHSHPETLSSYLRKKYKFAFWRVLAVRKNPSKGVKDSHTPQIMKLQMLLAPAMIVAAAVDLTARSRVSALAAVLGVFLLSTLPFSARAFSKDPVIGLLCPFLLAARACAQFLGVANGLVRARQAPAAAPNNSPA